ncbi:hypothetical protein ACFU8R_03815 [Pseudonocardia alni]|uniref:HipA-like C-terminal domain-containing protein n=1 Tax=Pseudonocardia alni TaxID=33907 RepID=A0AA44UR59_PSEA5|nr:hypothetical protein [Pseudonocardia alni]PKB31788.1 hypothetical protein ATL51_3485 [Pseudonocardia alni]
MLYPVVDVSGWEPARPETIGREEKLWLREPGAPVHSRERDWLFKPVIVPANGNRQGEDWAEKIVCELGELLGVPCAEVQMAVRNGRAGSVSRNVAPDGWNLVLGSLLLGASSPDYLDGELRPPGRPGHSPEAILRALDGIDAPPGTALPDAGTTFAGYLLLDAWVGNQDRHDQNWAVLRETADPGRIRMAPSYDHASSLGFNLRDTRRQALITNGVAAYAAAARAHRFEHSPGASRSEIPTLVDVCRGILRGRPAAAYWWERLESVGTDRIAAVVAAAPGMSAPAATFATELLLINRRRLLDVG